MYFRLCAVAVGGLLRAGRVVAGMGPCRAGACWEGARGRVESSSSRRAAQGFGRVD